MSFGPDIDPLRQRDLENSYGEPKQRKPQYSLDKSGWSSTLVGWLTKAGARKISAYNYGPQKIIEFIYEGKPLEFKAPDVVGIRQQVIDWLDRRK